jgi:hypothetical protein
MLKFLVMHGSLDGMFCMLYKVFYVHYAWLEQIWVDVTLGNKCNEDLVLFVCRRYLAAKQQRTNKRAKFTCACSRRRRKLGYLEHLV